MGLNLGVLGQVASRGLAGYQHGLISAESEGYKRDQEKKRLDREIAHQAIMESLAVQQNTREAGKYDYDVSQHPAEQAKATADLGHVTAETTKLTTPDPDAPLKTAELKARIANIRSEIANRGKPKAEDIKGKLDEIAQASGGDLGRMHETINSDPDLFKLRANRTIRDYDVAAAASRARKGALEGAPSEAAFVSKRVPEIINRSSIKHEAGFPVDVTPLTPEQATRQARAEYAAQFGEGAPEPQARRGNWEPTDLTPKKTPDAPQVQPADTLHGQMPHDGGQTDTRKQEAMAQRWDELTAAGMDGEAARQKVLSEFGGQ